MFSPDESTIALVASGDKTIELWDIASWSVRNSLTWNGGGSLLVSFSPDGNTIAAWNQTTLTLWDVRSGHELRTLKARAPNYQVIFSSDWKRVAWRTGEDTVSLFEMPSGRDLGKLVGDFVAAAFAFSQGGKMIAVLTPARITLWSIESAKEVKSLTGSFSLATLKLSPDGKAIAFSTGVENDLKIMLWDVDTGQLRTLKEHVSYLPSAVFSPDGNTIAVGSQVSSMQAPGTITLGGVRVWDVASGEELQVLKEPGNLSLSTNWKIAASWSAGARTIKLWDPTSWRELNVLVGNVSINLVEFRLDATIAVGWDGKALALWDVATGRQVHSLEAPLGVYSRLVLSRDTKTLVVLTDKIGVWDLVSGRPLHTLKGSAFSVKYFALSPDGKTIAFWGFRELKLWDLASEQKPKTVLISKDGPGLQHHAGRANPSMLMPFPLSIVFSPDGQTIALLFPFKDTVELWDVASGKRRRILDSSPDPRDAVAFSPDSQTIAIGGGNTITLWSAASGEKRRTLSGYDRRDIYFSPTGKMIAAASSNNSIKVWDIDSGWMLQTEEGHAGPVTSLAFAPDGRRIVSASEDHTLMLWDVTSGQRLRSFVGHAESVDSVAFDPNGTIISSGSPDGTIKLWDAGSGRMMRTLQANDPKTPYEVYSVVPDYYRKSKTAPMSPDGLFQVKLGRNGRIDLVNVNSGSLWASLIALGDEEWAVTTPQGRFDTNKPLDQIEGLHWIVNNQLRNPLPLDVFMRQYYEPRLLRRVLISEHFSPLASIADINRVQPKVSIIEIKAVAPGSDLLDVTVAVKSTTEVVSVSATDMNKKKQFSSGAYDVRLFRNGQLVGHSTSYEKLQTTFRTYRNFDDELTAWRDANKVDLFDGKKTFTFTVKPPANTNAKKVEFSAYAFNEDRVKSETARQLWSLGETAKTSSVPRAKPRAYVIAVGVNANENPSFDLQFAANDARRFQEVLPQRLAATGEYSEVVPISLISDWELRRGQKVTTKRDATKANFKAVLDVLAGRPVADEIKRAIPNAEKLARTTPDDMVLILFSSHGFADQSGNFYFIPYDTGPGACSVFTETVRQRSISSDELSLWLRDVDAGQMTLIVDACYSTAAIEGSGFKPGPMGSRGLGQLAYDKRMRILTATQADNVAMELPATADGRPVNHGLLSYALLEDGLGGNKADFKPRDKTIFMDEWLEYAVAEVPRLFANQPRPINEIQPKSKQRNDRPRLVLLKRELADPGVCGTGPSASPSRIQEQQPSLFDFTRRKREVPLVRNP